jgi:excisionase family DNA binding protein
VIHSLDGYFDWAKPHLFLSAGDVAKMLNVGVTTVQRWRRKGELVPFVQIGNGKRSTFGYAKEDVMAFMEEKGDWQMPPWANPEAVEGAA